MIHFDGTKLDPEFKEKWIQALESGTYPQARRKLFDGTGYCCLGVAAKVLGCEFKEHKDHADRAIFSPEKDGKMMDMHGMGGLLNEELAGPVHLTMNNQRSFAEANDLHHYNFKQIADLIRKNM